MFIFHFLAACTACRILVPRPGVEPSLPVAEGWDLNHWTVRKSPDIHISTVKVSSGQPSYVLEVPLPLCLALRKLQLKGLFVWHMKSSSLKFDFKGEILKSGIKHMPQHYTGLWELLYVHRNSHQILVERELWTYSFLHYQQSPVHMGRGLKPMENTILKRCWCWHSTSKWQGLSFWTGHWKATESYKLFQYF